MCSANVVRTLSCWHTATLIMQFHHDRAIPPGQLVRSSQIRLEMHGPVHEFLNRPGQRWNDGKSSKCDRCLPTFRCIQRSHELSSVLRGQDAPWQTRTLYPKWLPEELHLTQNYDPRPRLRSWPPIRPIHPIRLKNRAQTLQVPLRGKKKKPETPPYHKH